MVTCGKGLGGRRGFTLVELVVVVGIISVLVAIAVPVIRSARDGARAQKARVDVEILAAGVRQLAWDTGSWPGGYSRAGFQIYETWDLSTPAAGLLAADNQFKNWKGPYVPEVKLDPWGKKYFFDPDYRISGQWKVVVGSFGPNQLGQNWYDEDNIYVLIQ